MIRFPDVHNDATNQIPSIAYCEFDVITHASRKKNTPTQLGICDTVLKLHKPKKISLKDH